MKLTHWDVKVACCCLNSAAFTTAYKSSVSAFRVDELTVEETQDNKRRLTIHIMLS